MLKSYTANSSRSSKSQVPFFFQAEDGIRDADVTGVQTCALPIFKVFRILKNLLVTIKNLTKQASMPLMPISNTDKSILNSNPAIPCLWKKTFGSIGQFLIFMET